MQGVSTITSLLSIYGKRKIEYFTSDMELTQADPPDPRAVILVGGPRANRFTDRELQRVKTPLAFSRDNACIEVRNEPPLRRDASHDFGILALYRNEQEDTIYLLLAGIGSRGTLGASRYYFRAARAGALPQFGFIAAVEAPTEGFGRESLHGNRYWDIDAGGWRSGGNAVLEEL
jgi:hypothetical protein